MKGRSACPSVDDSLGLSYSVSMRQETPTDAERATETRHNPKGAASGDDPEAGESPCDSAMRDFTDAPAGEVALSPDKPGQEEDAVLSDPTGLDQPDVSTDSEGATTAEELPDGAKDVHDTIDSQAVVEAILFAADSPMTAARIAQIMGVGDARSVRKQIQALNARYRENGTAFRIDEIAGGFQMLTLPQFNPWLSKLNRSRQDSRLSPAALETLAIVAYREAEEKPVVRAEIEAIRGVSVGEVLSRLLELNLVKIIGRAEQIGRPMLYGTTKRFLEVFGLSSLNDLPTVEELKRPD